MLCPVHKKSSKLALLNEEGTGTLCWLCEANRVNEVLRSRLAILEETLREYADKANWQSAGTYKGEPSGVYLWNGWMRGIEGDPWAIAREGLKKMEEIK